MHKIRKIAKETTRKFKKEFKRQLRLAMAAAIGFLIAFAWKDFIFNITRQTIIDISTVSNIHFIGLLAALAVSLIGVILIVLSSRLLE